MVHTTDSRWLEVNESLKSEILIKTGTIHGGTHLHTHCVMPCPSQHGRNYLERLALETDDGLSGLTDTQKGHLCVCTVRYVPSERKT
jgi:hypothetical protein